MDVAYELARNVVKTKYENIPAAAIEATKMSILDTLGVIAAASTLGQGCKEIVDLVKESRAKGESTIIGHGGRVPSWMAGLANGAMTHPLDYDDVREEARVHPGSCSVVAAFAAAEEVGEVNGKEFLTAVTVAIDLVSRMGLSIVQSSHGHATDWHLPPTLGIYAATAAAGKIFGLNEDQMLDAFGHTLQQVAGSMAYMYSPGSVFRGIRDGFTIKDGMLSAIMAKKGLPGIKESMESKAGLFNLYFKGWYERSYLTDGLGKRFEGINVSFKPWPACRGTHPAIDATLGILSEDGIQPDDIAEINVWVSEPARFVVEPLAERRAPQTIIDARLSIPFALGVAVAKNRVTLKDFTESGLKDPAVLKIARKVTGKVSPELKTNLMRSIVEVKTKDGRQLTKDVDP
ncbi:MAG: MmgE/PrpD family protein, partial [Chloroflexi bacterium]|nr:MmgE/PrpD family protein [Chloroflexota bacterium]